MKLESEQYYLLSPVDGKTIDISEIPDEIFASGSLGIGIGIVTEGNIAAAPASGKLVYISDTFHSFIMVLENNIQVMVHIGLKTSELNGKGFKCLVKEGCILKAGVPIIRIDRNEIHEEYDSLFSVMTLINSEEVEDAELTTNAFVSMGKDIIIKYKTLGS